MDKTTRCTDCYAEFTDDDLVGKISCPSCGTSSLPCDIKEDVTIKINWHELRILTIWASNWAGHACNIESRNTLNSIIKRLESQRPEGFAALTLLQELKELPEALKKEGIEIGSVECYNGTKKIYPED